jgi:hypothetical protein
VFVGVGVSFREGRGRSALPGSFEVIDPGKISADLTDSAMEAYPKLLGRLGEVEIGAREFSGSLRLVIFVVFCGLEKCLLFEAVLELSGRCSIRRG